MNEYKGITNETNSEKDEAMRKLWAMALMEEGKMGGQNKGLGKKFLGALKLGKKGIGKLLSLLLGLVVGLFKLAILLLVAVWKMSIGFFFR